MKKKPLLVVLWVAVLAALLFGITHFSNGTEENNGTTPAATVPPLNIQAMAAHWPEIMAHAAAPPRGLVSARYTLAEFGDFQCPQCGTVRPKLEKLLTQYPAQINLIFVHRPFPFYSNGEVMHKWAIPTARAAQAAASFGKFWPMYDLLYSHQDDLEPGFYPDYAAKLGLDRKQFDTVYASRAVQDKVTASQKFTEDLGIVSTPTVLVRDNQTARIWAFQGNDGTPGQPGVAALVAHPPWGARSP